MNGLQKANFRMHPAYGQAAGQPLIDTMRQTRASVKHPADWTPVLSSGVPREERAEWSGASLLTREITK